MLAAGASALDAAFVDDWLAARADRRPRPSTDDAAALADFGLGEALARVHALADGHATLAGLAARLRTADARLNFTRLLYLLVETDLLLLGD